MSPGKVLHPGDEGQKEVSELQKIICPHLFAKLIKKLAGNDAISAKRGEWFKMHRSFLRFTNHQNSPCS
ncbi:hypothetical protein CU633_03265 [Bacillus sp. V3-13]|nr:hypothetical protein CU633_03265 [Bacillus sp. V3-13]